MSSQIKNLTVLMPTFNCGQYIGQAIRTILNQTFREFEFLIIDDGSTDSTEETVGNFNDSRIVYVKKKNSGLASTLNYGLQIASFDWVARMDADDLCLSTRLEQQLKQNLTDLNQISCTWCSYFKMGKILYSIKTPLESKRVKQKLALHSYVCHPSVIYNRKYIIHNNGYNEKLNTFEDYELWLRLIKSVEFKVVPEYLLFMRNRDDSLSGNIYNQKNIIHSFQAEYYNDFSHSFGITSKVGEMKMRGWREYFYGDRKRARTEWRKLGVNLIVMPKLILAYLISFLPEMYFRKIVEARIRYRVNFMLDSISHKTRHIKKQFENLLEKCN